VSGIKFKTLELMPEVPGDEKVNSLINFFTSYSDVLIKENPNEDVRIRFSFLSSLNRLSMKSIHLSFFVKDIDSIEVKNPLKYKLEIFSGSEVLTLSDISKLGDFYCDLSERILIELF
jgi:hypothetical protein